MYSQIDSNRRRTWFLILLVTGLLAAVGWTYGYVISDTGPAALIIALGVSLVMTLVSWYAGDKVALASTGAVELTDRSQFMTLWNVVENLAITAGIPRPRIYIIEDDAPNAFATGRDPTHASVAVTTGLLARLEKVELEGVLAHELGHIKNLDIRVMMVVIVLVGAITLIGDFFIRTGLGRKGGRDKGGPVVLIGLLFIVLAPLFGELIKLAISRKREYLADADGALLTRYPEGLARALEKIRDAGVPMRRASTATNHLWIAEPTKTGGIGRRLQGLLSTHPPIDDRIAKLRGMIT
ncbi:M48 family metallopeptidase [Candidatus Uhrbacteria bacterium]|nr:M48 family metallopeptidase [Candidatus Uhrbacteria bacterium]